MVETMRKWSERKVSMQCSSYLKRRRLEEVIFLIQYLGLGEAYSLAEGVAAAGEMPCSARSWSALGSEHPEFFRVLPSGTVTLGYRYYLRTGDTSPPRLSVETLHELVTNALALHERQAKRVEVWKIWVTMLAAVAASVTGIANLFWK